VASDGDVLKTQRVTPGIELALSRTLPWTILGAAASLPLLAVPQPQESQLLAYTIVHLSALVLFGLVLVWDLGRSIDKAWFAWLEPTKSQLAAGASVVALTVGVVALVTLPTSAALRLAPSLQFLQLLSALDIAFAASATLIGVTWWKGRRAGAAAGLAVGAVCVWSIWKYLTVVGFATDGGWQVDSAALFTYVLPFDMAAATIAIATLIVGARRVGPSG
jgi:hypothetical protein